MPRSYAVLTAAAFLSFLTACAFHNSKPVSGQVLDEAMRVGRNAASFLAADEDYFRDMDGGIPLNREEIKGRNNWIVWTGGNDRFWDLISVASVGSVDFLKTISSHPSLKFSRDNRWDYLGLVNEPCFEKAAGPDPRRFGLWLDKRTADCPADPFENDHKYPGVKVDARGQKMPVGSFYGYATGVIGLRLLPNPAFDEEAAKKWDPERYYRDPTYYNDSKLIRPYRVGMSCGFCHVGPNPLRPPNDPEHPTFANLSSNVGAQYFWVDRIFSYQADPSSFAYQVFHTSRPGSLDTSLVSTDNINNPRTMNAVYGLGSRLAQAEQFGKETLSGGGLNNKQFNDFVTSDSPLSRFFMPPATVRTPRVLKDGADSVGALGALNRVFLNIGLFSEEWLLHFNPLIGGKRMSPIEIAVNRKNSSYWQATEAQTPNLALFFLKSTNGHKLHDAPGGAEYLARDSNLVDRGKVVFADTCARCHSSKLPEMTAELIPSGCSGRDYLNCWNRYWAASKTDQFKAEMRKIVLKSDFLDNNFLSTEFRIPVTLLETNACSPLATNAIANNIWDNFSSQTYKDLPTVGEITVYNPMTGDPRKFKMPGGGRGYTRPASLISVWSTAPFLLNNSVGKFNASPSVASRLDSFEDSISQLLWPESRDKDLLLGDKIPGRIDRTTQTSYLRVPSGYVPDNLSRLLGFGERLFPNLIGETGIEIGPIPKGTPVSLLASLNVTPDENDATGGLNHDARIIDLVVKLKHDLLALPRGASDADAISVVRNLVEPLMSLSKCPDYVVNRGHYFGTSRFREEPGLSDDDKHALIAFLKTF